jgi:hypothetical protein
MTANPALLSPMAQTAVLGLLFTVFGFIISSLVHDIYYDIKKGKAQKQTDANLKTMHDIDALVEKIVEEEHLNEFKIEVVITTENTDRLSPEQKIDPPSETQQ